MLDKAYNPKIYETLVYKSWEDGGHFKPSHHEDKASYTVVIPPPNVTGYLHLGHALDITVPDILIRYKRMQQFNVLWQPGTDHGGIATQMVVERMLEAKGAKRRDIGRKAFLDEVWRFKEQAGTRIVEQQKRLGASCDWSRLRFTMDDGLSSCVRKVFVDLFKQKLIYRSKRLVNWDPKLQTAISDVELVQKEVQGHLWHFRYPIKGRTGEFLTVATTRPETMFGDTGVAVNPRDERYSHLIGQYCILPLVGREILIVGDEHADPEQGTGVVKITPAHDFNDFEVGRRHQLETITILTPSGHLNDNVPKIFQGLERYEARKRVVEALEEQGLVDKIEDHMHAVPHGDRSGVAIEPYLTDQWFVKADVLAGPALRAVEEGNITIEPASAIKTYYEWMRNIQPWCISRQLWWGHQIPAWYGPDNYIFVAENETDAKAQALEYYGEEKSLRQDEDVLDTWFSSGLWPFATLGWNKDEAFLKRHYPTDVMSTGSDLLFFWVARMIMLGLHFVDDVPFKVVSFHGMVRDSKGVKMGKSKGNVIDPLDLVEAYGADAVRLALALPAIPGRDMRLDTGKVEVARNFITKVWNAARFCEMNDCIYDETYDVSNAGEVLSRWLIAQTNQTIIKVTGALEARQIHEAVQVVSHFVRHLFCDWYVEFSKPLFAHDNPVINEEVRKVTGWALREILKLMHPLCPFVTEVLWGKLGYATKTPLLITQWSKINPQYDDVKALDELNWVIGLISEIRSVRAEMNVPAGAVIPLSLKNPDAKIKTRVEHHKALIMRLARVETISIVDDLKKGALSLVYEGLSMGLHLSGVLDLEKEQQRIAKKMAGYQKDMGNLNKKLSNPDFVKKAPQAVLDLNQERLAQAKTDLDKLEQALIRLKGIMS